jgi:type IV secretion system protein VirB6
VASSVFTKLELALQQPAIDFMNTASQGLASALGAPMRAALTLYVVWFGVLILRGSVQQPVSDFLARLLKAGVILTLTLSYDGYNTYVAQFFFQVVPNEIASALGQGTPATSGRFDAVLDATGVVVEAMKREAGSWPPSAIWAAICGGIAYLVMGALAAHGFFIFLFAKFALALVIGLGPVFIALALFDSTRRYCENFVAQVLNYIVLQVLAVAVLSMMLGAIDAQFKAQAGTDYAGRALGLIATGFFCFGVLFQLPSMAHALAGGGAFFQMRGPDGLRRAGGYAAGYSLRSAARSVAWATQGTRFESTGLRVAGAGRRAGSFMSRDAPRGRGAVVPSVEQQSQTKS